MNWYQEVLRKYAVFGGRARRKEYWFFTLFYLIFLIALKIIEANAGWVAVDPDDPRNSMGYLSTTYELALFIPALAVTIRRLHDTGRSGWWVLINFVPLIGWIVTIVFMAEEGELIDNEYGPDPKAEGTAAA